MRYDNDGPAPRLLSRSLSIWKAKTKQKIKNGLLIKTPKINIIRMFNSMFHLTSERATAGVICQTIPLLPAPGKPSCCWQPKTSVFNSQKYTGNARKTKSGKACARWSDERVHSHKWLRHEHHNFCRDPQPGHRSPWCYTNDEHTRYEDCDIPVCSNDDSCPTDLTVPIQLNEVEQDQINCGESKCTNARIINGRDTKVGEAPYQARATDHLRILH